MSKEKIPPLMTICIILIVVCITVITRGSLNSNDEKSIPAIAVNTETLAGDMQFNQGLVQQNMPIALMEFQYLKNYLHSNQVSLTKDQLNEFTVKITCINAIMDREKASDISQLSLDARELIVLITEQTYDLFGLKLSHNIHGDILRISDKNGLTIFVNHILANQVSFQLKILIIAVVALLILLFICLVIAKKNQLFMKDGVYSGLHEKKFA